MEKPIYIDLETRTQSSEGLVTLVKGLAPQFRSSTFKGILHQMVEGAADDYNDVCYTDTEQHAARALGEKLRSTDTSSAPLALYVYPNDGGAGIYVKLDENLEAYAGRVISATPRPDGDGTIDLVRMYMQHRETGGCQMH